MSDSGKRRKLWFCFLVPVLIGMLCIFGSQGGRKTLARTNVVKTPIGTQVKIVIPKTVADKTDDSMKIRITKYDFEDMPNGSKHYYIDVDFIFSSYGNMGRTSWESDAVFYDKSGKVLNWAGGMVGHMDASTAANECRLYVPDQIALKVAAIVFQEHYHDPVTLPKNSSVAKISEREKIDVEYPMQIASIYDNDMRAEITDYRFEDSETGKGFYLVLDIDFLSLGNQGSRWVSHAIFYDKNGEKIGDDNDGYCGLDKTITPVIAKDYKCIVAIPENLKGKVTSIVFQEFWSGVIKPSIDSLSFPIYHGEIKAQTLKVGNKKVVFGSKKSKNFKLSVGGKYYTSLSFKSSDTKIAIVKGHRKYATVNIKKPGKVKITITAPGKDNKYRKAQKTITLSIVLAKPKVKLKKKKMDGYFEVTVKWNKVKGAKKYSYVVEYSLEKYRREKAKIKDTKISQPFKVLKGTKLKVKVQAINGKNKGPWAKKEMTV